MANKVCLYHSDCYDGMGAAYAVWKQYPQAQFIPVQHGHPLPLEVTNEMDIILVDFAYPLDTMIEICRLANTVVVLDHHLTFAAVAGQLTAMQKDGDPRLVHLQIVYDPDRSGALIAWEYYHLTPAPRLIQHISDRDLWKFEIPYTKEIMAALGQEPFELKAYIHLFETKGALETMRDEGRVLLRKLDQDAENIIRTSQRFIEMAGATVPLVNCPYYMASEVLSRLSRQHPFALSYFDTAEERVFSIRSNKGKGQNVAKIAESFGGGGHFNAAGFRVPRGHELASL